MKKVSIVLLASGLLAFAACDNPNSASVGSYEKEETTHTTESKKEEGHGVHEEVIEKAEAGIDTLKSNLTPEKEQGDEHSEHH